jgi:hypothetical protein
MKYLVCLLVTVVLLGACTPQERAKTFGGTATVQLPINMKLVTATWKEDHLWYLVRPMREGEVSEVYSFKESSSFGIIQGEVIFKESK